MLTNTQNWFQSLLERDLVGMPRWKAFLIRSIQIFYASLRDLADGQISLQAMSLVYTTLITLVPLLAISFSVLKGFGVHNQIEPILLNILEGLGPEKSTEVTERVIGFVDNIKVGVLGAVGLALLIYAVIALMQKIEAAFNYIWRVGRDRSIAKRFSDYLSVLLMGPLLIFISVGITTTLRSAPVIKQVVEANALEPVYEVTALFIPWLVMAIGFTFVYVYMPNTKVRISAAFAGGLVAALLWKTMGYVFSSFIAGSANYVAVYAAFATLIVLMIWLYASWLVVLMGCNVSFYVQYPRYLRVSRMPLMLSPQLSMLLGMSALSLVTRTYYNRETPWTVDALSRRLNVPILAMQQVMDLLEDGGILATNKEEPPQYFPACPLDTTPLQKAIEALEKYGRLGWLQTERMHFTAEARTAVHTLEQARIEALAHKPIAQVLLDTEADAAESRVRNFSARTE